MDIIQPYIALLQTQDWLAQNGALLISVVALLSAVATGVIGIKQKRTPTGEAQLDDERQYRHELRSENKDLKVELAEVEKLNDNLTTQNKQLQKENDTLTAIKLQLEEQNRTLIEQAAQRDKEIRELKEDVARLTRDVTRLERRREPRTEGDNGSSN